MARHTHSRHSSLRAHSGGRTAYAPDVGTCRAQPDDRLDRARRSTSQRTRHARRGQTGRRLFASLDSAFCDRAARLPAYRAAGARRRRDRTRDHRRLADCVFFGHQAARRSAGRRREAHRTDCGRHVDLRRLCGDRDEHHHQGAGGRLRLCGRLRDALRDGCDGALSFAAGGTPSHAAGLWSLDRRVRPRSGPGRRCVVPGGQGGRRLRDHHQADARDHARADDDGARRARDAPRK